MEPLWWMLAALAIVGTVLLIVVIAAVYDAAKEASEFFKRANAENRAADVKPEAKAQAWER